MGDYIVRMVGPGATLAAETSNSREMLLFQVSPVPALSDSELAAPVSDYIGFEDFVEIQGFLGQAIGGYAFY